MKLEFITKSRLSNLRRDEVHDLIIDRIMDNRILLIEREFLPEERMELMSLGLKRATTDTSAGINMIKILIESEVSGLLRNRHQQVQFNLFTPGSSKVDKLEDGHYSVKSFDGDLFLEV